MRLRFAACALFVGCGRAPHETRPLTTPTASATVMPRTPTCAVGDVCATPQRPPGVVIDHRGAEDRAYVGSPSIAVLADGTYVASHDWFGPGTHDDETVVFASHDRGEHWSKLADIQNAWWSTLFVHDGALYLLGTSRQFGRVVIRRSNDGGRTWTTPVDATTGVLREDAGYHCAPTPVLVSGGRVWRAFEVSRPHADKGRLFEALVISAPVGADLLRAASWTFARSSRADRAWLDGKFENWLEGNVVVDEHGDVLDVLRVGAKTDVEHVALARVASGGASVTFDPAKDFVDLPGGSKKLTIRFDARTKLYWTLANTIAGGPTHHTDRVRNTLALVSSPDLRAWTVRSVVLEHPDRAKHAFQYVDWQFDGDDLVLVSRTAYDDAGGGAHSAHDANYLTFHRVVGFRA